MKKSFTSFNNLKTLKNEKNVPILFPDNKQMDNKCLLGEKISPMPILKAELNLETIENCESKSEFYLNSKIIFRRKYSINQSDFFKYFRKNN